MRGHRAVTLIEVMVVLGIAGLLAVLAVPSFQDMAVHYRAQESSRAVLMGMSAARAYSQRENRPARLRLEERRAIVETPNFGGVDPITLAASVRRTIESFDEHSITNFPREVSITKIEFLGPGGTVTGSAAAGDDAATIVFCASGESYFRDAAGDPVCGIGNLTSASAKIHFTVLGKPFVIRINEALGTLDLKAGS